MAASARPLVEELLKPQAYPHPAGRLRFIETHISWVFLAGDYAYKIKKPVNFGFLDYSSVDLRRDFCEQELRLNRRLCPEAYLRVVPIVQSPQGLRVGGQGAAVEYAVVMRRLPAKRMLDSLVRTRRVTEAMIERVALRLAEFHATAQQGPEIDRYGSLETISFNWQENFDQIRPYVGRTISRGCLDTITDYVSDFLATNPELLLRRVSEGRVRDCHGDLRAESICLTNGLCIYDCIEFNERFRYSDVAAEVAFLAMDLDALGRPDLGYWFSDRYVAATGDPGLRRLLLFYECYRAFVRGKVQSFRLDQPTRSQREQLLAGRRARRYLRLARSYTRAPPQPLLVVVCGLPGTGKTSLARALAGRLGGVVYSSDRVRKELVGETPSMQPAVSFETGIYTADVTRQTYSRLLELAEAELSDGTTVVLDATFRRAADRQVACQLARRWGALCWILECVCPESVVLERLKRRIARQEGASDADASVYRQHRATFEPVSGGEAACHLSVDTSVTLSRALERALQPISARQGA